MNQLPTAVQLPLRHEPHTLIDVADLERVVAAGPWHFGICDGHFYAQRWVREGSTQRTERLHTFLTGWPLVDHINGDGLDNRRANLRPATHSQNNVNRRRGRRGVSGFRGVYFHRPSGLWNARISVNGRPRSLGYHRTPEDAARVRDAAIVKEYGEFAVTNFPLETSA